MTPPPDPRPDLGRAGRVLALLAFLAAALARLPEVAAKGRFYVEEGTFFFAYAWHMPWRDALFHPLGGYLNIVATGAALADANLVRGGYLPLEWAPYLTQGVALVFQACPAIIILTARAEWLVGRWRRLAALALVATAPLAEQTWLNTLHSQFHLGLAAGLILALEAEAGAAVTWFRLALLALGPLCGPAAIALAPLFVARVGLLERTRARAGQAVAIGLGAAVQLGLFYVGSKARGLTIDAPTLSEVMYIRHVLVPLFGPDVALRYAQATRATFLAGGTPWAPIVLGAVAVLGALIFAASRWRRPEAWLILGGLWLAVISYVGAIGSGPLLIDPIAATRYAFVPETLFALAALAASVEFRYAGWLVAWLIAVGVVSFPFPIDELADGPDWRAEVKAWRADDHHRLAIWPKGWFVDLDPTARLCSADPHDPDPPDFCDQYWEASPDQR